MALTSSWQSILSCQIKSPLPSLPFSTHGWGEALICVPYMCVRVHTFVHFGPQFHFCLLRHRALESNQYNHITATYFLLAERMLRERQEKEQHSQTRSPSPSKAQFRYTHTPAHIHKHFLRQTECCLCSAAYCQFTQNKSDRGWTDGALFFSAGIEGHTENRREAADQQHCEGCATRNILQQNKSSVFLFSLLRD